jgi:hypothetical protein
MADTLIFKIDTTPTVSALQDVNDLLTQSKTKLKELTDAGKTQTDEYIAQTAVVKAYEKEQRSLTNVLVQQTGATKVMTKATEDNIKAGKAQENSIAENRKAYNALYNQLLQTAKPTKEQIATAKQLNEVLKEQEKALGNTSRNVGNYAEGFKEAAKDLNLFGVNIGGLSKGLEGAKAGFTAAGGGVKGFGAALATTGLPLIIMGVQALISAFETFEPVADAVEDSINAISNGFKGLLGGGSMSGAIKAGQELTNVMRDLEDTAAGYAIAQEQANREIRMLQITASDRTKSEKERLKSLDDADKVQKKLYEADVARNKKLLDGQKAALIAQTGLKEFELNILATTADAEDDNYKKILERAEKVSKIDKKKLGEYQKTLLEKEKLDTQNLVFEEQRVKLSNRIIERGEAQAEKAQAAREKAADAAKAAKEKADQAEAARLQKLEALETEFQLSERERLNKSFEDKLKTVKGNGERETLLRLDIVAAQEAALKKFDEDAETKRQEKEAARLMKLITDAKAAQVILADNAKMQLELQETFLQSQNDIDEEFAQSNFATFSEFYKAKMDAYKKDTQAQKDASALNIQTQQAELSASASITNSLVGLITQVANASGAGAEFGKAIGLINILVSQGVALAQSIASASILPFPANLGAIAASIGTITGLIGTVIQTFSATPEVPKFATGVIGLDGAGTATSDSIDARLSRGESVMTAKATERFAPVLAQMELAVGNRPNFQLGNRKFATGYIPTTDGGYSDRAMSNEVNNASTMAKMVSDSIAKMPQPKLVYDEFTNFVNNRNQSVNLSEL